MTKICVFIFCFFLIQGVFAREWDAHEVSLKASVDKIREKEKKIAELISHKNLMHEGAPELKAALEEITREHKELIALYKEFDDEKEHVRFNHPDQGQKIERKYSRFKVKTLDAFEGEGGIDGKLSRVKSKALKKFGEKAPVIEPEEPTEEEQEKLKEAERIANDAKNDKNSKRIRMKK
ncbi:MAG: hypothetical protein AB7F59_04000 [Bdellovibrionales bacterium]